MTTNLNERTCVQVCIAICIVIIDLIIVKFIYVKFCFFFISRHYFSILSCDSCVSWHETGRSIMTIVSTTPRPSLTWNSCERTKTSASSRRCVRQYCQTHLEQNQSHVSLTSCELNRRNYSEHVYWNAVFTSLELHFANCSSWTMRPSSLCLQPINTK